MWSSRRARRGRASGSASGAPWRPAIRIAAGPRAARAPPGSPAQSRPPSASGPASVPVRPARGSDLCLRNPCIPSRAVGWPDERRHARPPRAIPGGRIVDCFTHRGLASNSETRSHRVLAVPRVDRGREGEREGKEKPRRGSRLRARHGASPGHARGGGYCTRVSNHSSVWRRAIPDAVTWSPVRGTRSTSLPRAVSAAWATTEF